MPPKPRKKQTVAALKDKKGHIINERLPGGTMRFSNARMYQMKKVWARKPSKSVAKPTEQPQELNLVEKKIGGGKNGGVRMVPAKKMPSKYDVFEAEKTSRKRKHTGEVAKVPPKALRPSLTPGTIVILLVGPFRGRRAVFLKQLPNGMMLITGPFSVNGIPMRRCDPKYVIATSAKLDVSSVKVPENINDAYFKKVSKRRRGQSTDADIFAASQESYTPSDQRKDDQKKVDDQIVQVMSKRDDGKMVKKYLQSMFELGKGQFPHQMKF